MANSLDYIRLGDVVGVRATGAAMGFLVVDVISPTECVIAFKCPIHGTIHELAVYKSELYVVKRCRNALKDAS